MGQTVENEVLIDVWSISDVAFAWHTRCIWREALRLHGPNYPNVKPKAKLFRQTLSCFVDCLFAKNYN